MVWKAWKEVSHSTYCAEQSPVLYKYLLPFSRCNPNPLPNSKMVKTYSTSTSSTLMSSLQTVTNIKLRELAKQQKKLQDHYADVLSRAATENDLLSKVNILYNGIKEVKEHHPYISNLETLLIQDVTGPTVLQGWVNRLEKEIKRGQHRLSQGMSSFLFYFTTRRFEMNSAKNVLTYSIESTLPGHVFGSILQEWLRFQQNIIDKNKGDDPNENELMEDIILETPSTENAQELRTFQDFLQVLTVAHAPSEYDLEMIDRVLCENKESALNQLRDTVSSFMNHEVIKAVDKGELGSAIDALCAAGYLLEKDGKEELRKLKSDDMAMNEYASTLSILIKDFKEWDYVRVESEETPDAGMIRELTIKKYRNNKWRAFVPDQVCVIFVSVKSHSIYNPRQPDSNKHVLFSHHVSTGHPPVTIPPNCRSPMVCRN
ncbi:hypothetical protein BC938DRAFT_473385 [Jimgerdemannia flammicorona]|nr:hypothetical protein BC938DRAFT_473385 [Jimgerdemannia flammicorona]